MTPTSLSTATKTSAPLTSSSRLIAAAFPLSEENSDPWTSRFNESDVPSWGWHPFQTSGTTGASSTSLSSSSTSFTASALGSSSSTSTPSISPTNPVSAQSGIDPSVITRSIIGGIFGFIGAVIVFYFALRYIRRRNLARMDRDSEMAVAGAVDPFQGSSVRPLANVAGRSEKGATLLVPQVEAVSSAEFERPRTAAELEEPQQRPGNTRASEASGDRDEISREMSALRETIHIVLAERAEHVNRQGSSPPSYQSSEHDGS